MGCDRQERVASEDETVRFARAHGFDVVRVVNIGTLKGEGLVKRCFRLELRDGGNIKARRLRSPERAEEVATILTEIDHPSFPVPLARDGSMLLEPWVEGRPLDGAGIGVAEACGVLLGELHQRSATRARSPGKDSWVDEMRAHLAKACRSLRSQGFVSEADSNAVLELAGRHAPDSADGGYIHADLAPENMIIDRAGRIILIDNESVIEHPYDYDLARTWIRWPMSAAAKRAFLQAYRQYRDPDSFMASALFWLLTSLARAAAFAAANKVKTAKTRRDHLLRLVQHSGSNAGEPLDLWNVEE